MNLFWTKNGPVVKLLLSFLIILVQSQSRRERLHREEARHLGAIFRLSKKLLSQYFEKVGREEDLWEPKVSGRGWNLFPNHFILQVQASFYILGKDPLAILHLLDGPIVCILPSQQEHTKCILQTTLTLVQMYSFIYFFKDKKMTIRLN